MMPEKGEVSRADKDDSKAAKKQGSKCGATCALRCGICIGVLTEAEVCSQPASRREVVGQSCAADGPEMDRVTRDPSQRAAEHRGGSMAKKSRKA